MSFILDALRKSESRRSRSEQGAPGLDDRHGRNTSKPPRRRLRLIAAFAVILVATGLGTVTYLSVDRFVSDDSGLATSSQPPEPPVVEAGQQGKATESVDDATGAETDVLELTEIDSDDPPAGEEKADLAPVTETKEVDRRRRQRAPAERTVVREAAERERTRAEAEAVEEFEQELAEAERARAEPEPEPEPEPVREAAPESAVSANAPAETRREATWRPEAAEYVRAWELPLSIRRDMPEMKLTIHVFTPREEDRFVLINGERFVPGDRIIGGARLVDIRREGAIVDFREHRFLLEP